MAKFLSEDELMEALKQTASNLRQEEKLEFKGFSQNSLNHYGNLMKNGLNLDSYHETKDTYHQEVKPQLLALMSDISDIISEFDSGFNDEPSKMIGNPCPHGNPRSYAWASMTRSGRDRRNDLQFFVSLKREFLRFGIYVGRKWGADRFNQVIRSIHSDSEHFMELIREARGSGYSLDTHRDDYIDDGSTVLLEVNSRSPHVSIGEHGHFHLVRGISLSELRELKSEEVLDSALHAFAHTRRMYEFCLKKHVPLKFRLLEDINSRR